jgi:hypothetical protein
MIKTKAIITTGIPGARIDFVAGWLGTLPNFIDSQWRVDPITGRSVGVSNIIRPVDKTEVYVESILHDFKMELDPLSEINVSLACHGRTLENKVKNQNAITFVRINTSHCDKKNIFWEFIVKTYLTTQRWQHAYEHDQVYHIDDLLKNQQIEITDINRQNFLLNLIDNFSPICDPLLTGLSAIDIDYNKLFVSGGSQHLVKCLEINNATDKHHRLWDNNLQLATSPDTIEKFGKVWRKQDYFN